MAFVVDFSPRHVLWGETIDAVAYIAGASTQEVIMLELSNRKTNDVYQVRGTRLEKSDRPGLPDDTFIFGLSIDTVQLPNGGEIFVTLAGLPMLEMAHDIVFQMAKYFLPSAFTGGPITGGTTVVIGLDTMFTDINTTTGSVTQSLLTGLKIQFADTIDVAATLVSGDQQFSFELSVVTPDLSAVCTNLFTPNAPQNAASGYVPLTLVFPDDYKCSIRGFTFRPVSFVRFEPESIDIAGSSPVAALFSRNLVSDDMATGIQGRIGASGPVWTAMGNAKDIRPFPSVKEAIIAVQAKYEVPDVQTVEEQAPLPFQFPVELSFLDTPNPMKSDLRSFSLKPLSSPLLLPMDNAYFSVPVYGVNLFSASRSLVLYVYPTDYPSGQFVASVFDIEYVTATEWRIVGPKSTRWKPVSINSKPIDAWGQQSPTALALTGCVMSPFFLDYYADGIPLPPSSIQMRTYFFDQCSPRILPRRMRKTTDYVEIIVTGKGFGDSRHQPKILLRDLSSGQVIVELLGSYAPSKLESGEQVIMGKYYGSPYPSLGFVLVSAQIDGTNWVQVRNPIVALYDIANNAISPLNGNWLTPVSITVTGLVNAVELKGSPVTATVTFCDDDNVDPDSPRWKALTRTAVLGIHGETLAEHADQNVIFIPSPPRVKYANPSFRLQISIDGQPPIPTSDLCNMMTVDFLEPAWNPPYVAPIGGRVRIIGSNFVQMPTETSNPLKVKLAAVLPQQLVTYVAHELLQGIYGPGKFDGSSGCYELFVDLQVTRLSSTELVVTGIPALPPGLYDFKLGRDGEIFSPCQRLFNVYAWGIEERTLSFGALQRPTIALPFLSGTFPFPDAPSAISNPSMTSIVCGRIRIDKFSTELVYNPSSSIFSFVAPLMERGAEYIVLTYSPDGQRYVIMPNIHVVVLNVYRIEPPQAAAQVKTKFTLYGGPFISIPKTSQIQVQFHTLLPNTIQSDVSLPPAVISQPNGPLVTVNKIYPDRLEFTTTLQNSGGLILTFVISETTPMGSIMQFVWPPHYMTMIESGSMPVQMMSTAGPWPRLVNAFGIQMFEPRVVHTIGDSVISIHLHDPSVDWPAYLLPVVQLDTVRVRFQAQHVYAQGAGSLPYRDTSDPSGAASSNELALQQNFSVSLQKFEQDNTIYLQEGWIKPTEGNAQQNDATSVICVRTPRVERPGLYSIALSADGSDEFAPVLSGMSMFMYETGTTFSNNSVYALAKPKSEQQDTPIIITGQFLPPSNVPSFFDLQFLLHENAQLKIGPLGNDDVDRQQPRILDKPSVTTSSLTFLLPPDLSIPETNRLYLRTTSAEPFQEIGALLSIVDFDNLATFAYLTSYAKEISLTGSQFPYGREREATVRLMSSAFQLDCSATIESSSLVTFRLPKDGVVGDLYNVSVRFGVNSGATFLDTGLILTLYQPSEFEPKSIMANPAAWDSESPINYISIWGFSFNESVKLSLQLCKPDDRTVITVEKCLVASANELRVQFSAFPQSGAYRVFLIPSIGDVSPENVWDFGETMFLTVTRFQSFFPLFGEILPEDQAEQFSVITDNVNIDVYKPSLRWQSQSGTYEVTQAMVQVEQGRMICSIPPIQPKEGHPLEQEVFTVDCTVDHHSIRTYGPPGSFSFESDQVPIWRAVNPEDQFRFVVVKTITPSYAGTRGGEVIIITLSANLRKDEDKDNELEVQFGSVPGTNTRWISDDQIAVDTPRLSPSPQLTLKVKVREEFLIFLDFSVYEITEINPSFGIQSSQALHAFGKFLPPGKTGKIYVSLQGADQDDTHSSIFLPQTSSVASTPLPSSNDFWFFLPRGLDTTVAYDIWYCPNGNTIASLIPTAYRPFHINRIQPFSWNISQRQLFVLDGEFPPELRSTSVSVHFENRTNNKQFIDVPARWASDAILEVEVEPGAFPDICDLFVKVTVGQEEFSHYVNDPGTSVHTLISLYRLASVVNTIIPSRYGGDSFIVIDNVPDRLSGLIPSVQIGSMVVTGRLRTSGLDGTDIPGILFTAPPLDPGKYALEATLDATAVSWGQIENDCNSLFYYEPLPKTNAQAFGVSLNSKPKRVNPFIFVGDSHNKDTLLPGRCLSNGHNLPLVDSNAPLQILNLTGSNRLCNGDPIALRTIVSSKWKCLRLRRYAPAFSLDIPAMPDALVVDDSDASAEYPDCRESLFGIWKILPDENGHPYIDPSPQAEIRLGADRILIVSQAFSQEIDPALVEINHALKSNNGSGGAVSTAPILDLDMNTPVGIGLDFLTAPRPEKVPSGVLISKDYQVAVIDAFVDFALPQSVSYGTNDAAEEALYAKSTSTLIIDTNTMYMFASDISGSKGNNIWYWKVDNQKAVWKPLYDPSAAQLHVMDSKGNVRAVFVSPFDIVLFQQSQSTGLLRAIVVTRNASNNELTPIQTLILDSGLTSLPPDVGAPVFYSKFTVLYDDAGKTWHIFTVPANDSSSVAHIKYTALPQSPFIDQDSGALVSRYGLSTPDVIGSTTRFYGFQKSVLEVGSTAWYGSTAVSISAVATSDNIVTFNRYGGLGVAVNFDSITSFKDVTIPGLDHVNSGIGDIVEVDNKLPVVFKAKGGAFKLGDQWLFEVLPATISAAKPQKSGLVNISASGIFTNDGPLSLNLEVTDVFSRASSSSGEKSVQVTFKSSWYKDPDPGSESSSRTLEYSSTNNVTVGASSVTCDLGHYGVLIVLPPYPQSDSTVRDDGIPVAFLGKGDSWTFQCHQSYPAVECISQPPAACFLDNSYQQAYVAFSTYHGSGSMVFMKVDLHGNLLAHSLSPLRTASEFQMFTVANKSTLIFRGITQPGVTWANGISAEVDDGYQSILYPRLGKAYRMAHLGSMYKVEISDSVLSANPNSTRIPADLEPASLHPSTIALAPPGFNTVGAVEVLGASHLCGFELKNNGFIYDGLTACSTVSQRVNTGVFAPSYLYNIDRQGLLAIQTKVQDAMKTDLSNQYTGSDKNPFSDGSPIWSVNPLFTDADYGNDYHQWQQVFKWLYQLSLCQSLVDQGASWSGDIHHKVFFIPIGDTHRAAGKDFWSLRIGMERQKKLIDVAMALRGFKYRYSVHLKEQIDAAFPDLMSFSPFGGISNITGVSVCHRVTMSQLGKLPLDLLDSLLGDIVTELRYLDSNIYGQVLSHLNTWAIMSGLSSLMPANATTPDDPDDDDNHTSSPEDGRKQSDISKIAESLGPIAVFAAGGMVAYSIYKKRSGTKGAGETIAEINGRKGAKDGVRELNRPSESNRSWAIDSSQPRTMPTEEVEMQDLSDAFKTDDAVLRDGRDFMNKVEENPKLLDGSPELKEHVSALEEGSSHGRAGAVMEGAFAGLMILNLVGNWDQMGTSSKVLEIAGVACLGTEILGTMIASKFPALIKGAKAGLEAFGEKIGAAVGEKFMASATGRFLSSAGKCIGALEGLKILGPLGNIAFAVEGLISSVDDFKHGKIVDGTLELASSLAMLGAAICDLLVLAGATAAEGVGEVLMVVVIIIMLVEIFKDPEGFINMMKELGSELFGTESPEDEAIDDMIARLKNWVLSTTLAKPVTYDVSSYDQWPKIVARNDLDFTHSQFDIADILRTLFGK